MLNEKGPYLVTDEPRIEFRDGMFFVENTVDGGIVHTAYRPHTFIKTQRRCWQLVEEFNAQQSNVEKLE